MVTCACLCLTLHRFRFNRQIKDITQYYHAPVTRFLYNTIFYVAFLVSFSNMILQNLSISYTIQEGLIFIMVLALLLEELKQAFGPGASLKEYLGDGWNKLDCIAIIFYLGGFVLRSLAYVQVRDVDIVDARRLLNATWDNTTCASKNSTPMSPFSEEPEVHLGSLPKWAALPGLRTPSSVLVDYTNLCAHDLTVDHPYFLLMEERFTLARVMFALSLFAFFVRLMYIFSFSIVLGPKLIMINRMVVNDLLPFLLLLVVIQAGYGVSSFVISYPNGYYTHYSEKTLSRNMTMKSMTAGKIVYEFFMTAYFQMLGNFGLDILEGEDSGCRDGDLCPQFSSRKLSIVSLSFFILLTQLLMINLLVATFTSTYFEIEGSSTYFWSYQRYEMIQECVDRPSVAPPFTLLWYIGELLYAAIQRLLVFFPGLDDFEPEIADDPFCRNFSGNYSLESKLMKWEFMKAQNVLRSQMDSDLPGSRRSESSRSTIITRGLKSAAGMAGGGGGGTTGAGNKRGSSIAGLGLGDRLLEDLSTIFGPDTDFIEGRFYALSSQVEKMSNFEDRLERIVSMMKKLTFVLRKLQRSQNQVMKSLSGPGERRLVGARRNHSPEKKQITSQSIDNVIRKAIEGLSEHCQDIEGKIEEKLRIEGLCVKAVLANSYPSEIPPDHVAVPTMTQTGPPSRRPEAMPPSGGLYERVIFSHRLWRLVPFNFERRPGMRVNIPDDLSSWKVPYPEYRPFISKSERIAFPYPEAEDGPQIDPTKLQYNTYDAVQGVSRCGLHERVHVSRGLQCARGLPLNPRGRSGLGGKGLLPHWGPNHVIVLALTREGTSPNDFEVIMLERGQCSCLPWFFVDHRESCDFRSCSARVMREFLLRRVNHVFGGAHSERESLKDALVKSINKMDISLISDDFLDDQLNADHAWIEAVCINFHGRGDAAFDTASTKLFLETSSSESARWFDFKGPVRLRPSHESLLIGLLQKHHKI
uniref:Ion_trans domain-containing protein n=1 Tax=Mesocestoides corti TaxID=53468 RepID=A0A5K3FN55_MESCO